MKKLFFMLSAALVLTACGNESMTEEESRNDETKITESTEETMDTDHEKKEPESQTDENTQEEEKTESEFYNPEEIIVVQDEQEMDRECEKVKENFKLPYFYENTKVYSGMINPEQRISFTLVQAKNGDTETVQPDISPDGRFTLILFNNTLNKENNVQMFIESDDSQELAFELPIQVEKEGMEIVPKNKEKRDEIEQGTYLPDFYANTNSYYGKTVPNAEVTVIEPRGQQLKMTADDEGNFSEEFANFPYVAHGEANLSKGDQLVFLVTDKDDYSAYLEKEVLERSSDPNYTEPVSPNE